MNIDDFFDEINEMSDDRKRGRTKLAKDIEKEMVIFFNGVYADIKNGIFLIVVPESEYFQKVYSQLISHVRDTSDTAAVAHVRQSAIEIVRTTVDAYLEPDSNTPLGKARESGAKVKDSDIPKELIDALSRERAQKIGANESLFLNNLYENEDAIAEGKKYKRWHTMEDERVRPSHALLDNSRVLIDAPFNTGTALLMFPGDTGYGAPASETILCRCWLTYE